MQTHEKILGLLAQVVEEVGVHHHCVLVHLDASPLPPLDAASESGDTKATQFAMALAQWARRGALGAVGGGMAQVGGARAVSRAVRRRWPILAELVERMVVEGRQGPVGEDGDASDNEW